MTRHIPGMVITAHVRADDHQRALQAGSDFFLTKPLDPQALAAEIRRGLGAA